MAITAAGKTTWVGDTAGGGTTATSTSQTLTAGKVYAVWAGTYRSGGTPATPTLSGWTNVANINAADGGNPMRLTLFVKDGDGSSGTLAVSYGAESQSNINCILDEFTATAPAASVVKQSASGHAGSGTALATLAAFTDATNNAAYGGMVSRWGVDPVQGTGFTRLGHGNSGNAFMSEYVVGPDTSVDSATAQSNSWILIAVELGAAATDVLTARGTTRGIARAINRGLANT